MQMSRSIDPVSSIWVFYCGQRTQIPILGYGISMPTARATVVFVVTLVAIVQLVLSMVASVVILLLAIHAVLLSCAGSLM